MRHIARFIIAIVVNVCLMTGAMSQELSPLESILTDDDSVDVSADVHGSFDPRGYEMCYGENGEPRFFPRNSSSNVPGDENWSDQFPGPPGVTGEVDAIARYANSIYVGGRFNSTYNLVNANNIAKLIMRLSITMRISH